MSHRSESTAERRECVESLYLTVKVGVIWFADGHEGQ